MVDKLKYGNQNKLIDSIKDLKRRAHLNLNDLLKIIKWNYNNNIYIIRLSSDIFPQMSNSIIPFYGFEFCKNKLEEIGRLATTYKQQFIFDSGQSITLSTKKMNNPEKTVIELDRYAEILDLMNHEGNGVIIIHCGYKSSDNPSIINDWIKYFRLLSTSAQSRVVLENCQHYNIEDCWYISSFIKDTVGFYIPIVINYDNYSSYNGIQLDIKILISTVFKTWQERGIIPITQGLA